VEVTLLVARGATCATDAGGARRRCAAHGAKVVVVDVDDHPALGGGARRAGAVLLGSPRKASRLGHYHLDAGVGAALAETARASKTWQIQHDPCRTRALFGCPLF
jgi:hypothetical protein